MKEILKQEYHITNPFNEDMALAALKTQLSEAIFKELISSEKKGIKVTFIVEVYE